jgi:hypothetical protein
VNGKASPSVHRKSLPFSLFDGTVVIEIVRSGHHGTGHAYGGDFGGGDKVAANFLTKLKCLLQMHEGAWTTDGLSGCWQRYICKYCGVIEQRERHIWPDPYVVEYFEDGSCDTRVTCLHCGKSEYDIKHEGRITGTTPQTRRNYYCTRCGEYLGKVGDSGSSDKALVVILVQQQFN